jgi:succinate dehydrogenase/fumarate reductase flavoprotein subunit
MSAFTKMLPWLGRLRASPEVNQHYRDYILTPDLIELRNIAQVAELIVRCACIRKESRGLHYLVDFPQPDDVHWKKDTIIGRSDSEPCQGASAN